MDTVRVKVKRQEITVAEGSSVHLPSLMEMIFSKPKDEITLLQLIAEHNDELKLRIHKDYTYSTYENMFLLSIFVKGTAAPQGTTLGGGTQLLKTPFSLKTQLRQISF